MTGAPRSRRAATALAAVAALVVAAVVVAVSLPAGTASPAAVAVAQPHTRGGATWTGVYTGSGGVPAAEAFSADQGAPIRWVTAFLSGGGWGALDDPSWYLSRWPVTSGVSMDWAIPMLNAGGDSLAAGAAGAYDEHFANLARAFVAAGQPSVTFRLGWELGSTSQPWYAGSQPAAFARYWRRIVTVMRAVPGQSFRFDWNAAGSAPGDPVYGAYPGDAYVDYVSNDIYDASWDPAAGYAANAASPAGHRAAWRAVQAELTQLVSFGATHRKPIGVPEWGEWFRADGHGGGDDPYFVARMAQWLTSTPSLAFAMYYDADDDGLHALYDGRFPLSSAVWSRTFSAG